MTMPSPLSRGPSPRESEHTPPAADPGTGPDPGGARACASTAGVNALKNRMGMDRVKAVVYGDKASLFETFPARPIHAVVPVDYHIPGCPIHKEEFVRIVQALLMGKKPDIPDYPVCVECKLKDNLCVYELGQKCLGPITRAGCGAWCPSNLDAVKAAGTSATPTETPD